MYKIKLNGEALFSETMSPSVMAIACNIPVGCPIRGLKPKISQATIIDKYCPFVNKPCAKVTTKDWEPLIEEVKKENITSYSFNISFTSNSNPKELTMMCNSKTKCIINTLNQYYDSLGYKFTCPFSKEKQCFDITESDWTKLILGKNNE